MNNRFFSSKYFTAILFAIIVLTSLILHYPQLFKDLIGIHIWRQTQTQWNTLNFYRHDFNIFNPRTCTFDANDSNISRFEFPLMQWMVALVMKIFGDAIIVTRLCYFTVGVFASWGMYRLLELLTSHKIGSMMGAWAFTFSPVFFYYTINPLPDNCALFASIWFLYFFLKYTKTLKLKYIIYSALFLMVAALTKLPYILFGAGTLAYLIKNWRQKTTYQIILTYALFMLPAIAWYVWVIPTWGENGVLFGVFRDFNAETYNSYMDYHKKVMFPNILMNEMSTYLFFMGCLFVLLYSRFTKAVFWVLFVCTLSCVAYWLLELNMIGSVHDYYMMPFLPLLYLVIGYALTCLWRSNAVLKIAALVFICTIPSITFHSTKDLWSVEKSYINPPDALIYKDDLRKAVPREAKCFMAKDGNTFVYPYLFDKMGYAWVYDNYAGQDLQNLIDNKGVQYMYCSVRTIDTAADIRLLLKRLVMQRGVVKVWELQSASGQTKVQ